MRQHRYTEFPYVAIARVFISNPFSWIGFSVSQRPQCFFKKSGAKHQNVSFSNPMSPKRFIICIFRFGRSLIPNAKDILDSTSS